MKTILQRLAGAAVIFFAAASHAQTETNGLTLVPPDQIPRYGAFYPLSYGGTNGMCAPAPCPPDDPNEPIYWLGEGQFLVDNTVGVADGSVMTAPAGMFGAFDSPGGSGGGDGQFGSNSLWLELVGITNSLADGVTNNSASFVVHTPQPGVFDLFYTTNFTPRAWYWIARGLPDQTNFDDVWIPAACTGFFIAGSTNGIGIDQYGLTTAYYDLVGGTNTLTNDLNSNGIADAWEISYFGDLSQSATNSYDGDGVSNYDKYQNGLDPNLITFSFWFAHPRVNLNSATGTVAVLDGVPSYMAVLINSTNFAAAQWQLYNSNFVAFLGTNDGSYDAWLGLRGRAPNSQATWQDATVTRDTVPPVLVISNPMPGSTVSRPMLQLLGSASEPLQSLSFSITNAFGSISNHPGFVIHQQVDTNAIALSTNWFQCYDLVLANGTNAISLRAIDLAGNAATTNLVVIYDPSTATNAPTIAVVWPADQSVIAGTNFSIRGMMNDDTGAIWVSQGGSNSIQGTVERGGLFRVANLLLNGPTNVLTLAATNTAGYGRTLQLTVYQSSVRVTVDPISAASLSQSYLTVTGEISDTNHNLSVNDVQAVINADGTWAAVYVPVIASQGTADFDISISPSGNLPSPPSPPPDPIETVAVVMPSVVRVAAYTEVYDSLDNLLGASLFEWSRARNWEEGLGGSSREHYFNPVHDTNGCDTVVNWPSLWPDGQTLPGQYCRGGFQTSSGVPWMNYAMQAGGSKAVNLQPGLTTEQYSASRRVQTALELAAGGPAQSGVTRLILLTISAAGYSQSLPLRNVPVDAPYDEYADDSPGDTPVALSDITADGQPVTASATNSAVGKVLVEAPSGSVQSLPIAIAGTNGQANSISVQTEDLTLSIQANGITLAANSVVSNANFCVGRVLTFSTNWSQLPPGVQSRSVQWAFDGNFVNDSNQPSPDASINYTNNPAKLTNETTSAWWISGGLNPPATYSARLTESLTLSDGSVIVLSAKGLFSMIQPLPTFHPEVRDAVRVGTNFGNNGIMDPEFRLQFGVNTNLSNVGIAFVYTNAPLDSGGNTYGRYFVTQIVQTFRQQYNVRDGTNCSGTELDGIGLDTSNPYGNRYSEFDHDLWTDSPGGGLTYASWLTLTNSFRTVLMFQPKPYTSSAPVPMYEVDWNWSGTARTNGPPNSWVLVSGFPPSNPRASATSIFPVWAENVTNNITTTNNLPCFNEN